LGNSKIALAATHCQRVVEPNLHPDYASAQACTNVAACDSARSGCRLGLCSRCSPVWFPHSSEKPPASVPCLRAGAHRRGWRAQRLSSGSTTG
jgi:hypothetical protein